MEEVEYLNRYPATISEYEYNSLLSRLQNNKDLKEEDIELIKRLFENYTFWMSKYSNLRKGLQKVIDNEIIKL